MERNRLLFFNSYFCRSKEDILYFTLYVMEQLNLQPDPVNLVLNGSVDAGSEIFHLLDQYIRPVSFSRLPGTFTFSPLIQQSPAHYFTELYGIALCGS